MLGFALYILYQVIYERYSSYEGLAVIADFLYWKQKIKAIYKVIFRES